MKKIEREIVFITDPWDKENSFSLMRKNTEGNTQKVAMEILNELKTISDNVTLYTSIEDFSTNVQKHIGAIVLTTYYGCAAPNSKALIPSICETHNICYVGADSYTQMLCNDKHLSKKYISDFGLDTPLGVLVRNSNPHELELIETLQLPVVVKPNYGGGSNGISNNNLVHTYEDAIKLVKELLVYQELPILVEEYIPGYEAELVVFGNKNSIIFDEEIGLEIDGVNFFEKQIWGFEAKKAGLHQNKLVYTNHISPTDRQKIHSLFSSFNKAEIMRIDCRISGEKVYILELSPDCYLGPTGGVARAFAHNNISYSDMFYSLIKNALNNTY